MAEITLTKENFETEVLNANCPILVDFWASWCGPCRMLAPTIEELAKEYEGRAKVGKVNVDDEPELANRFGIASIPTILIFKDGKLVATSIGVKPKASFEELLK